MQRSFGDRTGRVFFAHHVGGRAGTVAFPELPRFADQVYNVIYDADETCIAAIEQAWKTPSRVFPYCLGEGRRQATFFLNFCRFTSSMFRFNPSFGHFYEEKRLAHSDYLFEKTFEPQQEVALTSEAIDGLFADGKIPPVDFLSLDTQGAELSILEGSRDMLATTTVAVSTEVSFAELYQRAPLFGNVDGFLRAHGFLLANLAPMAFGYKRIPKGFRGPGMPLQGEALYFVRPEQIANSSASVRQRRLEKLAFCALAFGYTDLAFDAVERSLSIDVLESTPIQQFLRHFHSKIQRAPALPPLWHELPAAVRAGERASTPATQATFPVRLMKRLLADPRLFVTDVRRALTRLYVSLALGLNRPALAFNGFERFLADFGFHQAAREVCRRRIA